MPLRRTGPPPAPGGVGHGSATLWAMTRSVSVPPRRVGIVADDLIWASRLASAIERAGGQPIAITRPDGLPAAAVGALLVDLGTRRVDALALLRAATTAGLPVLAVGQHDDIALRKRALAAGATRVYSYNKFHADGQALVSTWLATLPG
jgi:DNA-binding NarL/FixJ family response regulator